MKKKNSKIQLGNNEKIAIKGMAGVAAATAVTVVVAPAGVLALFVSAPVWAPLAAGGAAVAAGYTAGKILDKNKK